MVLESVKLGMLGEKNDCSKRRLFIGLYFCVCVIYVFDVFKNFCWEFGGYGI